MASSRNPQPVGLPARRAALDALHRVLNRGEPLDRALERAARDLVGGDRGLAHAMAAEALRRLPDLDRLIDSATRQPLPADAKARAVLRLMLVQALSLGTPPHATVAATLPLLAGGPKRLAHGVFGTLTRRGARLPDPPTLPAAVAERWEAEWGPEMVTAAARAIAQPPPLDRTLRAGFGVPEGALALTGWSVRSDPVADVTRLPGFAEGEWWVQDLAASLPARLLGAGEGGCALDLCAAPGGKTMQLADAGWRVTAVDREAARLERMAENLARVGLAAELVVGDVLSGRTSSPPPSSSPRRRGSMQGPVTSSDDGRLDATAPRMDPRLRGGDGGEAGEVLREPVTHSDDGRLDATAFRMDPRLRGGDGGGVGELHDDHEREGATPWHHRRYPAVLLDAPCSATGTFRRHPEVLHRATPRSIAAAAETQAAMIDSAVARVEPGGRLVYAVCSLERAEGEDQVAAALARHPALSLDPIAPGELPPGVPPAAEGWLRTLPTMLADEGTLDGFFAARFRVG